MYLEREDHVTGLIRLLSVGLRVLTLLEFGESHAGHGPADGRAPLGLLSGGDADYHPRGPGHAMASDAALPCAAAHSCPARLPSGCLYEAQCALFTTTLKMSEP